ncbi:LssY C-terminal domain-containing protein [Candidatus Uhrbacteria bacterium]|nr:LssY C-terminal domain-containing protein [Candidatus Uhrbacteria bacterium]
MEKKKIKPTLINRLCKTIEGFFGYSPFEKMEKKYPVLYKRLKARLATNRFTGLALTLLVLAFLIVVFVLLGITQDFLSNDPLIAADIRVANLLYAFRSISLLSFFYGATLFAEASVIIFATIVLSIVFWYKRHRLLAVGIWLAIALSESVTYIGKTFFHRARPSLRAIVEDSFSFPSGHATTVAVFYGFLVYLCLRKLETWKTRFIIVLCFTVFVGLVDFSRVYLGVHYISDVLAGNLVGLAGVLFAVIVIELLSEKRFPIEWKKFHISFVLPSILSIIVVVIIFFFRAPVFTIQTERATHSELLSGDVSLLFAENNLPKYSETLLGEPQEPVNIIIVAPINGCLVDGFSKAGWFLSDSPSLDSIGEIALAALNNASYPTAPITPSFYNSQPNDFGFEKETNEKSARERHHARFWDTGYSTPQGEIYVGTASLDIGIKWGITHRIAPDIDTERELLSSNLQDAGVVDNVRTIQFVSPILGSNFSGDPFFTNGMATILTLSDCH